MISFHEDYKPALLKDTLETLFENMGAPPISVLKSLEKKWHLLVGHNLSSLTEPLEISKNTLVIGCSTSEVKSQVEWRKNQIVDKYFEIYHPDSIDNIDIKLLPKDRKDDY